MVMNTMLWPDEVRATEFDFLDDDIKVRPAELSMASSLIESMTGEFDPDEFTDDYREALQRVIDAKVSGEEITEPEPEHVKPTAAIDLMAALKASVDRAKAARGERGGPVKPSAPTPITAAKSAQKAAAAASDDEAPAKSTRAKATTAPKRATSAKKSTPAKKTAAAKKSTSTKSTAKKAPARKAG